VADRINAYGVVEVAVRDMVKAIYTATAYKPIALEMALPHQLFDGLLVTMPSLQLAWASRKPDGRRAVELHLAGGLVLTVTEEL
jgi:hypothetical protein